MSDQASCSPELILQAAEGGCQGASVARYLSLKRGNMPYLQLDVNGRYPAADKKRLAAKLSHTYSTIMSVDVLRITVAIREFDEGSVWRITKPGGDPEAVSIMMLDIRKGRSPELRMEVAKALCADCIEILGLKEDCLNVEFTQHSGDEMYHPSLGGYSPEWSPEEHRHDHGGQ